MPTLSVSLPEIHSGQAKFRFGSLATGLSIATTDCFRLERTKRGDLTNEGSDGELPWRDVLTAAARACGPVDVATADHHGLFYPGRREVCVTHLMRENLLVNRRLALKMRSHEGHVVVRVAPGGESFRVILTDNGDESDRVRAVSEPFRSRSGKH